MASRRVLTVMLLPALGAVAIAAVAVVACSDETLEDLPNKNQDVVQVDMTVYQAPDQFPNVTFFCNGSTGVYLTTREQGQNMQLLPNDGRCIDKGPVTTSG